MNKKKTLLTLAIAIAAVVGVAAAAGVSYENVTLPVNDTLNVSEDEDIEVAAKNVTDSAGNQTDVNVTINATNSTTTETLHDVTLSTGTNTTVATQFDINGTMWDNATVYVGDDYNTTAETITADNLTIQTVSTGGLVGGDDSTLMVIFAMILLVVGAWYLAETE